MLWAGVKLDAWQYLLDDVSAGQLMAASAGRVQLEETGIFGSGKVKVPKQDNILVVHPGGFGDLLWLNAVYEKLAERGVRVHHSCFPYYAPVLQGFAEAVSYPLSLTPAAESAVKQGFDEWVHPEPLTNHDGYWREFFHVERAVQVPPCMDAHPADRMAARFGVELGAKKAAYRVTDEERTWARVWWPRKTGKRRVALQSQSSVALKSYPHFAALPAMLHEAGFEVLIIGEPRRGKMPPGIPPTVRDCTMEGADIRTSLARAAECDVCLGADSVLIHFAHAMDIPAVGLFGPFSGAGYMKGYRGIALQGRAVKGRACSPCHMDFLDVEQPPDCRGGLCRAIMEVMPHEVVAAVQKALEL